MPFKLANFPRHAAAKLARFLDYKSLLRLREVSWDTRSFVDISIHITWVRKIEIQRERVSSDITLSFVIPVQEHYLLWQNCIKNEIQRLSVNYLFEKGGMDKSRSITVVLAKEQLRQFLECVKLFIRRAYIRVLKIDAVPTGIVDIFSDYMKSKNIIEMQFITSDMNPTDFFPWLDFIKKLDIDAFDYITQMLAKDDIEFLQQIATRVTRILSSHYTYNSIDIVSYVQAILSGKTNGVVLFEKFESDWIPTISFISTEDIEKLLQSFHRIGKKVSFLTYTDAEPMDVHIGMFKVTVQDESIPRHISIRHSI